MARHRRSRDEAPEQDDEEDPPRPTRRAHRHRPPPGPVRQWNPEEDNEERDDDDELPSPFLPGRRPVFFRARDSLYFEPLIALALVVLLLVGLFAFTQNWPPIYVVESSSMQHGTTDQLGLLNTGDLVLAQKIDSGRIVDYFGGSQSGYTTYGEYGDVVLYWPNGIVQGVPIVHRVLLYLSANTNGTFSAPSLAGQPCGGSPNAIYRDSNTPSGCGWNHLSGTLTLLRVGWQSLNVTIPLGAVGTSSGFVTMGDNNLVADEPPLTHLVQPSWIIGAARGMIPWFGAIKLALEGNAGQVPSQSWQFMGLAVIGAVLGAFGVHYLLRAEGIEDQRRKDKEAEERREREEEEEDVEERRPRRRHWPSLRGWRIHEADQESRDSRSSPRGHRNRGPGGERGGGRPRPHVRRGNHTEGASSYRQRRNDDEEDL